MYIQRFKEYKEYKRAHNKYTKGMVFNKTLNEVIMSKEKTKREKYFTSRYWRYLPVLKNNCAYECSYKIC